MKLSPTLSPRALARVLTAFVFVCLARPAASAQQPQQPAGAEAAEIVRVTLLQVNDVYQIAPVERGKRGGLARVHTLRKQIQAESPHTLYLLGGDTLAPSVASNIFKGRQMISVWNATGLDLAVLGNHEFDFGDQVLRERMKESRFTWLGTNVIDRKTGRPFGDTPPTVVRELGGVRVGFFGLLTPDTKQTSSASADVEFREPCAVAKEAISQLNKAGARVVVALTHMSIVEDKALARCAPGLAAIIGGHEHTVITSLSARTPIFKMGSDAVNLGRIDLLISKRTGELEGIDWEIIPVTDQIKDDPESAAVVAEFEKKLSAELDQPVGTTTVVLDARQETNRTRETNLGSFVADAYRRQTNSEVALVNGGSIRSNTTYGPGPVTKRDVLSILPFENSIVKIEVTGATLRAALEHGVARAREEPEAGRFPQVSGLRFSYDARRPVGSRVTTVSVGGRPLDDRKTYTLALSNFVRGGGDGYAMFKGARLLIEPENAQVEPAVIMNLIAADKQIAPKEDGRIRREDQQP
ncbi:MAG TPA: bifunctional UDP-sugar hydrolase/5'-nucleotidase [Pyrinomonadaceae bacterium]